MSRLLFANLPVADLQQSVKLFTALGFTFDERFTDEHATCVVVSDQAYVMLLTEPRFQDFTNKAVADATRSTEVIMAVSADSRDEVDQMVHTALANGAKPANDPLDYGTMYGWSFQDPDGHLWEVMWMDPRELEG